jgi:hypothetical protein
MDIFKSPPDENIFYTITKTEDASSGLKYGILTGTPMILRI